MAVYLTRMKDLIVNPRLLSRFQIGAYDQQIWEKSVEQREIKVRRFWARFAFWRPFSFSLACYAHFRFVSLSFLLLLSFLLPVFLLFLFNSFLFYRGGGHTPVSPLFISISIPSSSSVVFLLCSLFLW